MKRRLFTFFIGVVLFLSAFRSGVGLTGRATPVVHRLVPDDAAGLQVLYSGPDRVLLRLSTPTSEINADWAARLEASGTPAVASFTAQEGQPQLPMVSTLLAAPPGAQVQVKVLSGPAQELPGQHNLTLAPSPAPLSEDLTPGKWQAPSSALPVPHQDATGRPAAAGGLFPAAPAVVAETAWLRDQYLVRLEMYPFQWNPASSALLWRPDLLVEVRFVNGSVAPASPVDAAVESSADGPFEALLRENLANYTAGRSWRSLPQVNVLAAPAAGLRLRINIDEAGLYRLDYATLKGAGLDVDGLDATCLHLTNQGRDVAIYIDEQDNNPGRLSSGEAILFYGEKFSGDYLAGLYAAENSQWRSFYTQKPDGSGTTWKPQFNTTMVEKYTGQNVYWLAVENEPGARMATQPAAPVSAPPAASFRSKVHAEQEHYWDTKYFTSEDTLFWDKFDVPGTVIRNYSIDLPFPALSEQFVTVRGEVVATTNNSAASPDHSIEVYLNEWPQFLFKGAWDGKSRFRFEGQVPQNVLLPGENRLKFVAFKTANPTSDTMYFDWFEIEYARQLQATNDYLVFSGENPGEWQYKLEGFTTTGLMVMDISQPLSPVRILNPTISSDPVSLTFTISHGAGANFLAAAPRPVSPAQVSAWTPPDLSVPVDYVIITHRSLVSAAQRLADHRQAHGLSARVIDVADLYNRFNYGIFHPIAIKNFLAYTFAHWSHPPSYVLLIGDGHWNLKGAELVNYTSPPPPVYMPPNLAWVDPWQGEVDSANLLATVVGSDPLPDVHIARLPVNSPAELNAVIDKISAYEQAASQDWQRNVLFVADIPDSAGDFVALSESIINSYMTADHQVERIYESDYGCQNGQECLAAKQAILDTLNTSGALLVNYTGHASVSSWSGEQILVNNDIKSLANGSRLPVILSMTCLDGYWILPGKSSLIEELVRAEQRGAIAAFSPTGLGVASGHDVLQRGFYEGLFRNGNWLLGPAVLNARLKLYATGGYIDLLHTYTIFGDPALRVQGRGQLFLPVARRSP